ncbi:MAG: hypothetical protein R3261_05570 [Alphaproteobacteria bacterium]|nr:hypothetical protein [Alphaproteobacteria bacterium]
MEKMACVTTAWRIERKSYFCVDADFVVVNYRQDGTLGFPFEYLYLASILSK